MKDWDFSQLLITHTQTSYVFVCFGQYHRRLVQIMTKIGSPLPLDLAKTRKLTLREATARSTQFSKMQSYKNVYSQKKNPFCLLQPYLVWQILCHWGLVIFLLCVPSPTRVAFGWKKKMLEMLRVPLVTILARELRLKIIWSPPSFGDVASAASRGSGERNAIENHQRLEMLRVPLVTIMARETLMIFLKSTKLWRCCECR